MKRVHALYIILWYLILGLVLSLAHTWVTLNFFDNGHARGPARLISARYWFGANRSTTGRMIGDPNEDGIGWDIIGVRNSNHRVFQIRHQINIRGYTGVERDFKPGSIPTWTRVDSIPSIQESKNGVRIIEQLNGWPFLAWRGEARMDRLGGGAQFYWCIPSTKAGGTTAWDHLILFPFEPVFPGVLYNAIFFGGISFVCVRIGKHTRNRIRVAYRQSQNKCTRCAYDITDLDTCPECGQVIDRSRTNSTIGG